MGKRGFPAQPKAIAELKETARPVRYPSNEEAVTFRNISEIPIPPSTLNTLGQATWNGILSELVAIKGLITTMDLRLFEQYCQEYSNLVEMRERLKFEGYIIENEKGDPIVNPLHKVVNDSLSWVNKISQQFGFSPSTRTGIRLEHGKNKVDPLAKFR